MSKYFIGMRFIHSLYGEYEILAYEGENMYKIIFFNTSYTTSVRSDYLYSGKVIDRMSPSVFGVGILGDTETKINGKHTKEYTVWSSMIQRCYDKNTQSRQPTYIGCEVSENFKHLTYFKEWCNRQVGFGMSGYDLDKDILVKGNKVYSEDTCCFVPREINSLFGNHKAKRGECCIGVTMSSNRKWYIASVGISGVQTHLGQYETEDEAFAVYKQAKEHNIQKVALKYKTCIDERVFDALMTYVVNKGD